MSAQTQTSFLASSDADLQKTPDLNILTRKERGERKRGKDRRNTHYGQNISSVNNNKPLQNKKQKKEKRKKRKKR